MAKRKAKAATAAAQPAGQASASTVARPLKSLGPQRSQQWLHKAAEKLGVDYDFLMDRAEKAKSAKSAAT